MANPEEAAAEPAEPGCEDEVENPEENEELELSHENEEEEDPAAADPIAETERVPAEDAD